MQIWADASYKGGKAGLGVLVRKLTKTGMKKSAFPNLSAAKTIILPS